MVVFMLMLDMHGTIQSIEPMLCSNNKNIYYAKTTWPFICNKQQLRYVAGF